MDKSWQLLKKLLSLFIVLIGGNSKSSQEI